MIKIDQLKKSFGSQTVLSKITTNFLDKGLTAIVGPSGCGKTTLLNIIAGIDNEFDGYVEINGFDLSKATKQELIDFRLHHIGYIF